MSVRRFLPLALAGLCLSIAPLRSQVQTGSKIGPEIDTVAVVSVYGPSDTSIGLKKKMETQALLDHIEGQVVQMLQQKGLRVLPVAATAARIQAAFDDTYYQSLEPANKASLDAVQDYHEYFKVRRRADHNRSSTRTTVLKEYWRPQAAPIVVDYENARYDAGAGSFEGRARDSGFDYTTHYRTAAGMLAKQAGASAYVIVRALPASEDFNGKSHTFLVEPAGSKPGSGVHPVVRIDMTMLTPDGTQVFMRTATGIADKGISMMQVLKMSWDEKDAEERFVDAADRALAAIANHLTGPRPAAPMAADVMAPPAAGVTLAWTGNEPGGAVAASSGITITAQQLAGRWELTEVNGQPLPYNQDDGTIIASGIYEFKADGSYTLTVNTMVQERGSAKTKTSNTNGAYTIDGNLVHMKPKGLLAGFVNGLTGNAPLEIHDSTSATLSWTGRTFTYKRK